MNTQIKATAQVIDFLKKQPLFSTSWADKSNGETATHSSLEEAKAAYDKTDVMDFDYRDKKYWYNNTEGQTAELRVIEELPVSLIEELNDATDEEEMMDAFMYADPYHTYSRRIETKYSYLSDDWNEEGTEKLIKQETVEGITYGTYFGEKPDMIVISELLK